MAKWASNRTAYHRKSQSGGGAMRHHSIVSLALVLGAATSVGAQGPMQVVPSGRGTSEVTLLLVDSAARAAAKPAIIRIDYGQPHLRGRKLLTDSLVPYDKLWRLGANNATTLTTGVDLVIGGKDVPKGTYELQAIPSRTGWKLIVQKEGTRAALPPDSEAPRNPANDIAQVDLRQSAASAPLESLTMWLIPARGPGKPRGQLVIAWGSMALTTDWAMK